MTVKAKSWTGFHICVIETQAGAQDEDWSLCLFKEACEISRSFISMIEQLKFDLLITLWGWVHFVLAGFRGETLTSLPIQNSCLTAPVLFSIIPSESRNLNSQPQEVKYWLMGLFVCFVSLLISMLGAGVSLAALEPWTISEQSWVSNPQPLHRGFFLGRPVMAW